MWLKIKDDRKKLNLNEILKMIIKKRKEEAKNKAKGIKKQDEIEEDEFEKTQNLDHTSRKYHDLYKDVFNLNMKILDSGNEIDSIEKRVLAL